jgi:hypothetical protein
VKERPILFSAPMVRALLDGSKTQTRRVVKPQPSFIGSMGDPNTPFKTIDDGLHCRIICPYGQPGDQLWVREAWRFIDGGAVYDAAGGVQDSFEPETLYRADRDNARGPWKPSIHMPRWASRITLEVTCVRVERLKDISEADALAEGVPGYQEGFDPPPDDPSFEWSYRAAYARLWDSINGAGSWELNPLVWVLEFKVVKP